MKNAALLLIFLYGTPGFSQVEPVLFSTTATKGAAVAMDFRTINNSYLEYVDLYKNISVREMERAGIPASVTLAQGILESNAGRSDLAVSANNHFGIKCGGGWNGRTMSKIDDDFNPDGTRRESCFRRYTNPEESFYDHSEFLRDPRKANRYGYLFNLDRADYKGWARGLQASGYATSQIYADQLIDLIERYTLYDYDRITPTPELVILEKPATTNDRKREGKKDKDEKTEIPSRNEAQANEALLRISRINDVKVVLAQENESLREIAKLYNIKTDNIVKFNDRGYTAGQRLKKNDIVFIQYKRFRWRGRVSQHYVKENQSMFEIAQTYGIRRDKLYRLNNMEPGAQPAAGERINLKYKRADGDPVQLRGGGNMLAGPAEPEPIIPEKMTPDDDYIFGADTSIKDQKDPVPIPAAKPATTGVPLPPDPEPVFVSQPEVKPFTPSRTTTDTKTPVIPGAKYHSVEKGDTLYNLSKRYNTTTAKIKQLNNMRDDYIRIGQSLRVK